MLKQSSREVEELQIRIDFQPICKRRMTDGVEFVFTAKGENKTQFPLPLHGPSKTKISVLTFSSDPGQCF
jgi:hypothetical protein